MGNSYHNTTNETGATLRAYIKKTRKQDIAVLKIFMQHNRLTPYKAWIIFNNPDVPMDSIKRAINTLTNEGYLIKTKDKEIGRYKRPNHIWEMNV